MATTALEVYDYAMRHRIGPHLRALGLKGSGQHYALPHEHAWALVGFQKASGSRAAMVRFTIDLSVISRSAWAVLREEDPTCPTRPRPGARYGVEGHVSRIGGLLPHSPDVWWSFGPGDAPPEKLAEPNATDVCAVLSEYAVPYLHRSLEEITRPTAPGETGVSRPTGVGAEADG
ncbi:DUF4304 domain-containing protein [Streptomyces sp. NPDC002328]|uniref:DUF4304 domain-containing protein n=1 Tax=Streptomyces sp. NPDC002328 TaxID=3364642 RepID=UPI0036D08DAF